jgi:hypothetical protein
VTDGCGKLGSQTDEIRLRRRAGLVEDVGQMGPRRGDRDTKLVGDLRQGLAGSSEDDANFLWPSFV